MKTQTALIIILSTIIFAYLVTTNPQERITIIAISIVYHLVGATQFIHSILNSDPKWLNAILMGTAAIFVAGCVFLLPMAAIPVLCIAANFYYTLSMGVTIKMPQGMQTPQGQIQPIHKAREIFNKFKQFADNASDTEYIDNDYEKLIEDMKRMELYNITHQYAETFSDIIKDMNDGDLPEQVAASAIESLKSDIEDLLEMITITKKNSDDIEVYNRLKSICENSIKELQAQS